MNRAIKFRGKRIDNGEWVYGYYFKTPLTIENFGAGHLGDGIERHCISTETGVVYAVIPETVGQFTGLKDKNGKEIYEGDIVSTKERDVSFEVVWFQEETSFMFKGTESFRHWGIDRAVKRLEVICNIHDNPELMNK